MHIKSEIDWIRKIRFLMSFQNVTYLLPGCKFQWIIIVRARFSINTKVVKSVLRFLKCNSSSTILTPDILNRLNFARYWNLDNLKGLFSFKTLYVIIQPNLYFFEVDKCKNWYVQFWQTAEPQMIKSVPKTFLGTDFIWVTVSSINKMDKDREN